MEKEIWLPVKGFGARYKVSNLGRVYSIKSKKLIKLFFNNFGYGHFSIYTKGRRINEKIHRVVAEAFIPNPDNKPEVNHINGNKKDNSVSNLEWCTRSENLKHCYRVGLRGKKVFSHSS